MDMNFILWVIIQYYLFCCSNYNTSLFFFLSLLGFLVPPDAPGLSCIFPASALEWTISLRNPDFFYWRRYLEANIWALALRSSLLLECPCTLRRLSLPGMCHLSASAPPLVVAMGWHVPGSWLSANGTVLPLVLFPQWQLVFTSTVNDYIAAQVGNNRERGPGSILWPAFSSCSSPPQIRTLS